MREDDRRRIANGGSGLAGQAFCESLIALTGRMRAFLHELEAYEGIPVGTDAGPLLAAFAEVLGSNDGTGSLRRLESVASGLLRSLSDEPGGSGGGGGPAIGGGVGGGWGAYLIPQ